MPRAAARSESAAQNQHDAIADFIKGTIAEAAPVVPISAQLKYNVDAVCEYIVKRIPVPVRDFTSPPQVAHPSRTSLQTLGPQTFNMFDLFRGMHRWTWLSVGLFSFICPCFAHDEQWA